MWVWEPFVSAIIGAIVGGAIAGFFSLRATKNAHENAIKLHDEKEKAALDGLLHAIHDEVEALWDRYLASVGQMLEASPKNTPFNGYYVVKHDYFTVYNNNAFMIGHIPDHNLRKKVVEFYVSAKGLLDSYAVNNESLQKFDEANILFRTTQDPFYRERVESLHDSLIIYARVLREQHEALKEIVSELLGSLKNVAQPSILAQ